MSETSKKFDPGRELAEAALDAHLRAVALRNGRAAALFLAAFTAILWPTDLLVFHDMPHAQRTIAWARGIIVLILLAAALAMRTRLGPRRPVLLLSTAGALIMVVVGWCLGALGGADAPWIYLALPALFFTVVAPVRPGARAALVGSLAVALALGFVVPHPEHLRHPMIWMALSFLASLVAMVVAVGHLSFRILRQSFYQSIALERASRQLGELNETLESRVRAQTGDLRRLTDHLERAREDERSRIARELHDELGQELTALNLALALTRRRFAKDPACIEGNLGELEALLERTRKTTRNLVTELRPRVLDELGLIAALEWLARQSEERAGVRCRLDIDAAVDGLAPELSTVAFRVIQEALTNVARHSGARQARLGVRAESGQLVLVVADDGVGMPPALGAAGFGLIGIRERVRNLDGRLDIESRPGSGTTLTVRLPLASGGAS